MAHAKTAAPCEVCGTRVSHHGTNAALTVGYTTKGVPRVIHARCEDQWRLQRQTIMAHWPERRPEVFSTLSPQLQHRIQRAIARYEETMARGLSRDRFTFPPQVSDEIRRVLKRSDVRKGTIKKLYELLQREHPDWMPPTEDKHGYSDFYQLWNMTVKHLEWEQSREPEAAPSAPVTTPPPPPPSPTKEPPADELVAMANAAHALIDLAVARQQRATLEFTLESLADLLKPHTPSPS